MPLSPQEQQELAQLEQKFSPQQAPSPAPQGGLSPAEQQELAQLEKTHGDAQPSLMDRAVNFGKGAVSNMAGAYTAYQHGLQQAGTLGYGDDLLQKASDAVGAPNVMGQMEKANDAEHPWGRAAGDVGGAIGMGALTGMGTGAAIKGLGLAGKGATMLGGAAKAAGRVGVNTAAGATQGYVTNPHEGETREGNAAFGGALSGGLSTAGELIGAATGPAARIKQNLTAQKDREGFAQLARDKIAGTRQGLVDSTEGNAGKLEDLLRGKQIPVSGTEMEGNELNALKKSYDAQARRPSGAIWSTGEAAKAQEAGGLANQARTAIEKAVPEAEGINADMQREIKLRSWLKKAGDRAPIQTLTTPSADKQALLSEAGRRGGSDIAKFAGDSRLAKSLTFRPSDLSHMGMGTAVKAGGRLGLEGLALGDKPAELLKNPAALSALLDYIQTHKQ